MTGLLRQLCKEVAVLVDHTGNGRAGRERPLGCAREAVTKELSRAIASASRLLDSKRAITRAVERVAEQLGNTAAVCRKSYIHPAILDAYIAGRVIDRKTPCERAVVKLLRNCFAR